jgi:transcriptional regulator with XRE-family HTH domain
MSGQYIAQMQESFSFVRYTAETMATNGHTSRLRELREAAGLSLRELARQIGEQHTNVSYWERSGQIPRSDVVGPIAKALGVTVEEILGLPKPRRATAPGGKVRQLFEEVSRLPRRQQDKIVSLLEPFVVQQRQDAAKVG